MLTFFNGVTGTGDSFSINLDLNTVNIASFYGLWDFHWGNLGAFLGKFINYFYYFLKYLGKTTKFKP